MWREETGCAAERGDDAGLGMIHWGKDHFQQGGEVFTAQGATLTGQRGLF